MLRGSIAKATTQPSTAQTANCVIDSSIGRPLLGAKMPTSISCSAQNRAQTTVR
ncbi:hypothetical protein D3C80_2198890 [compost metagenome]